MTDIVPTPAAPTVPIYPALGSANFNQEAYAYGTSMPEVSERIWEIGVAAEANASAARADAIAVADDRVATGQDRVATGQDRVATGQDRVATGQDRQATAADKLQTGQDRVATGQDRVATGQDRVQTGQDRAAAVAARDQAQIYATSQLKATSSTSVTPGTGSKSFAIEPSRSFVAGMYLVATSQSDLGIRMSGYVQSYNITTGALVIVVDAFAGAAAKADWVIGVAAVGGGTGTKPVRTITDTGGSMYGEQQGGLNTINVIAFAGRCDKYMPANPTPGDEVVMIVANGRTDNQLFVDNVAGSQRPIMGLNETFLIDVIDFAITLVYVNPTLGWRMK